MIKRLAKSWSNIDPNYRAFLLGIIFLGMNQGILSSTFNNYLHSNFHLTSSQRGFIEFPREFPGFALIFVTALLSRFSIKSWAILVCLFSFVGLFGLGQLSPSFHFVILWMLFWSMGDHLFMPVESTMGLLFAKENQEGRKLGQISGMKNLAAILGTLTVTLVFSAFHLGYKTLYFIASLTALVALYQFTKIKFKKEDLGEQKKFIFRKQYNLFYILNILFGARKQLFLTFSPWVLVSVFHVGPETMATIVMISAILGFVFRQYFGILVDKAGERFVMALDAVILLGICLGFALSRNLYFLFSLFILDNLMFSVRIARITYLKKIAVEKQDIPPTISLGITLDHVISMSIPFVGGLLWSAYGYPAVFFAASSIAVLSFIAALKIPSFFASIKT